MHVYAGLTGTFHFWAVTFADESSGEVSAWAWDFDSDGVGGSFRTQGSQDTSSGRGAARMEVDMNSEQSESPVKVLRAEHQVILRVVRVLGKLMDRFEQAGEFAEAPLAKCVEFLRLFADACHHGKEEDLLFPVLESRGIPRDGGPIGVMLYEHQIGRGLTKDMAGALTDARTGDAARTRFCKAARQYVDLLTDHIYKEDNILFTMGDRMMNPDDQAALGTKFCAVNCRAFEGRRREELQQIADELEAECGHG